MSTVRPKGVGKGDGGGAVLAHLVCHYWTKSLPTDADALLSLPIRLDNKQDSTIKGLNTPYFSYSHLDICLHSKNVPGHDT